MVVNAQPPATASLTIGSPAPKLDIELWFTDREGEFERTTEFEPGKIYVIDFLKIRSPSARRRLLKYADLQDRHMDDDLQIICVSDEAEETIADFLDEETGTAAQTIYAEVAIGYCFTSDPDGSVLEDYFGVDQKRKRRRPAVFLVGKTGRIEWLGNPNRMQQPLEMLIAGTWDRNKFKAVIDANRNAAFRTPEVRKLQDAGDPQGALKIINELLKTPVDDLLRKQLLLLRLRLEIETNSDDAAETLQRIDKLVFNDAGELNDVAWSVVTWQQSGKNLPLKVRQVARKLAYRAAELSKAKDDDDQRGAVLDTVAHLEHINGNLKKAFELQTEASELYPVKEITDYLDQLTAEVMDKTKPDSVKPIDSSDDQTSEREPNPKRPPEIEIETESESEAAPNPQSDQDS